MSTVGQVYYNVADTNSGGYISNGMDIYTDIVAQYGATQFNKIGIQAPSGTRVVLNINKTIMLGRTGIYELDDDIPITNLYFVHPRKYIRDDEASNSTMKEGTQEMIAADATRQQALEQLSRDYPVPPESEDDPRYQTYWDRYNNIQDTYIKAYNDALVKYNTGVNGIYKLPNPNNVNAPENFEDLYNVIVDFTYD